LPQRFDEAFRVGEVGHGGGFGDFDQQAGRVDLAFAQQVGDEVGQRGVVERAAGDVDRDRRRGRPLTQQLHGLAQHPAVDFENLVTLFGNRDEQPGRRQFAAVRVAQADQRLQVHQFARLGLVDALVVQLEQVVAQCARQALVPGQAVDHFRRRIEIGAVGAPSILAGLLGLVHGGVGAGNQLILIGRVQRVGGDAEAGRDVQGLAWHLALKAERNLRDGAHHALGQRFGLRHVGAGHQDGEFVAAQAEQHFVAPDQTGDFAGHPHQHRVAGGMTEVVVDGFEFVEVEVEQRGTDLERPGQAAALRQHAFEFVLEAMPVVQAGERIAFGQVKQLLGGLAFAGDIFVDP
jgi:hypothetical protein